MLENTAKKINYDFSGVDAPKTKDGFYGLRYGDFVVPLVKAVQELSKKADKVDSLEYRIAELENQNQELKQRLEKLEAIVLGKKVVNTLAFGINLEQNIPNPSKNTTSIGYSIPTNNGSAQLQIIDNLGRIIKTIKLNSSGRINLDLSSLSSGTYTYSLVVDGKVVETKKLIKTSE